ncbi:MAG: hypothetical protein IJX65_09655 [Alistipes sp.]|nr:hypothetical protein [Alistipes sp.]
MKGIGRRVTIGFLSIVALLFASGVISLFELSNLSNDTETILAASRRNLELAKDMLKFAHEHSQATLHIALFDDHTQHDICRRSMSDLEGKLAAARSEAVDASRLDSLSMTVSHLREVSESYLFTPNRVQADTLVVAGDGVQGVAALSGKRWYDEQYKVVYDEMVDDIQNFMTHTHSSLAPRAEQLNKNAYRSVAPVLISLVVMIAIVLMFYYFIRIYCVNPIVKMNRALSDYLSYRLPFNVKADLRDEFKQLADNIDKLIGITKQNR